MIDRCQNHVLAGSRVRRHYLKHDYADETKQAWAKLGAAIEAALAPRLRSLPGSEQKKPLRNDVDVTHRLQSLQSLESPT